MNAKLKTLRLMSLGLCLAMFGLAVSAAAANRYWDGGASNIATNGNGASEGGAGTWDTALLNWDQGSGLAHVAWNNAGNDTAVFAGAAGTVTLSTSFNAGGLAFNHTTGTYTLQTGDVTLSSGSVIKAGTGGCVASLATVASADSIFRFQNANTANNFGNANVFTVSSAISGASAVQIVGNGASTAAPVYLSGGVSYTGTTTVDPNAALGFNGGSVTIPDGSISLGANASYLRAGGSLNNATLKKLAATTNTITIIGNNGGTGNALDLSGSNGGVSLPNASLAFWDNVGTVSFAFTAAITPGTNGYLFGSKRAGNWINIGNTGAGNNILTGTAGMTLITGSLGNMKIICSNTFNGRTINNASGKTITLSHNLAIQNSAIDTSGAGTYTLDTGITTPTVGGLIGTKNLTNVFVAAGYGLMTTLTLNPGAGKTNTYSGVISDGAPRMSLIKSGAGAQILTGTNAYTGNTTVQAGMLALSQPTFVTNSSVRVDLGAVLQLDFNRTNAVTNLVLNGVSQPVGIYNSTNAAPYLAGVGSLEVYNPDTDGDGIPDWWTQQYFGHPTGQAGDLSRAQDDADGDGLNNLQEFQLGTNPRKADTDGDGLSDGYEVNTSHTNPLLADTDGDGLSDGYEVTTSHSNPLLADTDGDGLSDGDEVNTYHTNPLLADTDGDGAGDWYEVYASFTSPTNAASKPNIPYPLPKPDNSTGATNKPVKVFILSGQSNMVGMGDVNPTNTPGTLSTIVKQQGKFPYLLDTNGNWSVRKDVLYRGVIAALGDTNLMVGQGNNSTSLGPELGFGHVMGYYCDAPVLVLKSCQGGRALGWDFLPPGIEQYTNGTTVSAGYGDSPGTWTVGTNPVPGQFYGGYQYDQCFLDEADWAHPTNFAPVVNVTDVLDNFATEYPQWAAQGFEISGFVWFQGWNDGLSYTTPYADHYETNLVQLIKQLRIYYENRYPGKIKPNAPFVVATCGFDGWSASGNRLKVVNAQLAVSNTNKYPEFAGNVKTMEARGYWRDVSESPNAAQGYHYWHNAETYMLVGDALGRGMIDLLSAGTGNDYANWAASFPGANLTDPNADFDGDGLNNNYERIWGLIPTNALSKNPFVSVANLKSGTFTYTRRTSSLTGLNYTVWTSADLFNWIQDAGAVQTPALPVAQIETVTVNLSPSLLTNTRLFVRLRAQ